MSKKEAQKYNNTYKKWTVRWFNKHLFFASSFSEADIFRLPNPQLLVFEKPYVQPNLFGNFLKESWADCKTYFKSRTKGK